MKKVILGLFILLISINVLSLGYGDINDDGKISAIDYVMLRKYIMKNIEFTDNQIKSADMNIDNKVNSLDYILLRKKIINGEIVPEPIIGSPTITPKPTATPTSKPVEKYEVVFLGSTIIETSLTSSVTLLGSSAIPIKESSEIKLTTNKEYVVSFDYKTTGGTNQFDVDLYPDSLPQTNPTATTTEQHYDWILSSADANMASCKLRFFDDIQEANEKDIIINNIILGTIKRVTKNSGDTIGTLPTPTRNGYKFLGWYTKPSGGTKVSSDTKVTANMKLYSRWETTETYVEGPGEGYYSRTVTYLGRTFKDYKQNRMGGGIPKGGCGPVSLYSILSGYRDDVTIDDIIKVTGLSTSFHYINQAANKFGLSPSKIYQYNSGNQNATALKNYTELAISELKKGNQIIILVSRSNICPNGKCNNLKYDEFSWGNHFIAIVGVKSDNETVIVLNPMEGRGEEGRMEDIIKYYSPGGPQGGFVIYRKK